MTLSHISNRENLFFFLLHVIEKVRDWFFADQSSADTKMTWHILLAIFCKHFTTALEGLARSSIFRPKMHQMSFGGRAPPGPAGGAYTAPHPRPLAALKLVASSALDLASRLQR